MRRRALLLGSLAMALALALTWIVAADESRLVSPSTSAAETQAADNNPTLNVKLGGEPTLDPALATETPSMNVIEQLFISLVDLDEETAEVKPELANSWTTSPDASVYTFTLRSDVLWSDGSPVTAGDARYGILHTLDPATGSGSAYVLHHIENAREYNNGTISDPNQVGVTAIDATTLRITFEGPAAYGLSILTMPFARSNTHPVDRTAARTSRCGTSNEGTEASHTPTGTSGRLLSGF